jgi:hypothetical protein
VVCEDEVDRKRLEAVPGPSAASPAREAGGPLATIHAQLTLPPTERADGDQRAVWPHRPRAVADPLLAVVPARCPARRSAALALRGPCARPADGLPRHEAPCVRMPAAGGARARRRGLNPIVHGASLPLRRFAAAVRTRSSSRARRRRRGWPR